MEEVAREDMLVVVKGDGRDGNLGSRERPADDSGSRHVAGLDGLVRGTLFLGWLGGMRVRRRLCSVMVAILLAV